MNRFEDGTVVSCEEYAKIRKEELKERIAGKYTPTLAVVQVGDDPASNSYIRGKQKDCEEVGIEFRHIKLDKDVDNNEVDEAISQLNYDDEVDGIILQLPLPEHLDIDYLTSIIYTSKDVDGFDKDSDFVPCTPKGIIDWLEYNGYEFEGKHAVVAGRSNIVGKPLVNMLIDRNATVACLHSKSRETKFYTERAQLFISAIGRSKYWDGTDFRNCCEVVVDVGINRDEDGKLCGDVDKESFERYPANTYITPVPKGVGLLTRVALLENVFAAAYI